MKYRHSIKHKLVLAISLFVTLIIVVIASGTYHYFRKATSHVILEQQFTMLTSTAHELDDKISTAQKALIGVAKVAPPNSANISEIAQTWLNDRRGISSIFSGSIYILNKNGVMIASVPARPDLYGTSFAKLEFFSTTMTSGKPYISAPYVTEASKQPVISMTAPIRGEDGSIIGLLCGSIDLLEDRSLFASLKDVHLGSNGYLYLFAPDRTMIFHPDASRVMKKDVKPGANKMFDRAVEGFEGSGETTNSQGKHFLASFKRLQTTGWILAANYPIEEAFKPITLFRDYFLTAMFAVFLASIALAWKLGGGISAPIRNFIQQLQSLSQADADMSQRLDTDHSNELGLLADSFNSLLEKVRLREKELQISENRFRRLFEKHGAIMMMIEPHSGRIVDANRAAEEFYGYTIEQLKDMYITDINQLSPDMVTLDLNNAASGVENFFVFPHRLADGSIRTVEVHSTAIGEGANILVYSIIQDITERILANELLEDEHQILAGVIEATNAGTWAWNIQTRETVFNKQAAEIIGCDLEEISPGTIDDWMKYVHPDDLKNSKEQMKKIFQGELTHYEFEMRLQHKNGTWVWIINRGKVTRWTEDGKPLLMQGTHQDITARKMMEQEMLRLIEEQSIILENAGDGIAFVKKDRIKWSNATFGNMFGYNADELADAGTEILYPSQEDFERFSAEAYPVLICGETFAKDLQMRRKDGSLFIARTLGKMIDTSNPGTGSIWLFADVSIQKDMELQLVIAKENADAANRAKSYFLATMSHEIRTPMNGIIGMAALLIESELNQDQRAYAEIVYKSGENLLALINDILDFSKIEAGKLHMEVIDFDIRTTLEETAKMLSVRAGQAGLDLICKIDPEVPHCLKGDPGRLRQIITNLAGNSIKFTQQGEIIIAARVDSESEESIVIRFEVKDTGIGIPANRLEALFTPFTQVDGSTTRKYGGTGLGLAICKQLAELMGGEIGIISEEGKGSTFWFTAKFEMHASDTNQITEVTDGIVSSDTVAEVAERSTRILLVEDNIINQKVAQKILGKIGYKADVAVNGVEAVRALEMINYDVVLMDCQMPEMDGYEATAIIRDPESKVLNHKVPIIAITANAMEGDREKCIEAGMDDYLAKPVKKDDMARMLEKWVPTNEVTTLTDDGDHECS